MNLNHHKIQKVFFLAIAILVLYLAGCVPQNLKNPSNSAAFMIGWPSPELKFHVWDHLPREGREKLGYGMYTYVLFRHRVDTFTDKDSYKQHRLYQSLLDAITASTPTTDETTEKEDKATRIDKKESNIFYIPSNDSKLSKRFTLKAYNSELSMNYIYRLAAMIDDDELVERLTNQPGPFLISTFDPLGRITEGQFPLLYFDISGYNPSAMREIVASYKQRVKKSYQAQGEHIIQTLDNRKKRTESKRNKSKIERFRSLRLSLLNWFLNVDDDLKIIRATAANWLPD